MTAKRYAVWFNPEDHRRYKKLKIKTAFHKKIKELFNIFLEKKEAS